MYLFVEDIFYLYVMSETEYNTNSIKVYISNKCFLSILERSGFINLAVSKRPIV